MSNYHSFLIYVLVDVAILFLLVSTYCVHMHVITFAIMLVFTITAFSWQYQEHISLIKSYCRVDSQLTSIKPFATHN